MIEEGFYSKPAISAIVYSATPQITVDRNKGEIWLKTECSGQYSRPEPRYIYGTFAFFKAAMVV
jgi:hypothetical protein